jgi:hypothetical protein
MFYSSKVPGSCSPSSPRYAQETQSSLQRKREKRKARRVHATQDSLESLPLLSPASQESIAPQISAESKVVSTPFFMKPRRMHAVNPDAVLTTPPAGEKKELLSEKASLIPVTPLLPHEAQQADRQKELPLKKASPARAASLLSSEVEQAAIGLVAVEAVAEIRRFLEDFVGSRPEEPIFARKKYEQDDELWGELEFLQQKLRFSVDSLHKKLFSNVTTPHMLKGDIQGLANECESIFVAIRAVVKRVPEKTKKLEDWLKEKRTGALLSVLTINLNNIIITERVGLSFF